MAPPRATDSTIDMTRMRALIGSTLLLLVGFLVGWGFHPLSVPVTTQTQSPVVATSTPTALASVMLDFGDGTVRTYNDQEIASTKTVFDLTKKLSETGRGFTFQYDPPGQYGILVNQIGDKKGGTDGKYWLLWVNNRMAEQSADTTALHAGDVVEWKFINLKSEEGGVQP